MDLFRSRIPNDKLFLSALVLILLAWWLGLHWHALGYYWNWDDLHLIRQFTGHELAAVFAGPWDVDGVETSGFRPLTVLFNDFRYMLIGESPAGQRLLLLAMMAGLLWTLGWICLQFRLGRDAVALALLMLASTKAVAGDILWIADGVHIFQNLLIGFSVAAMILFIRGQSPMAGLVSLAAAGVALWTREDSLTLVLLLPVLFVMYYCLSAGIHSPSELLALLKKGGRSFNARYAAYFFGLSAVALATLGYRAAVVPDAQTLEFGFKAIRGFLDNLSWSTSLVGQGLPAGPAHGAGFQSGSLLLKQITRLWGLALASVAVFGFFFLRKEGSFLYQVAACAVCMILASTPGLVLSRANTIFLPTFFFALLLATTMTRIWSTASAYNQVEGIMKVRLGRQSYNGVHLWTILICLLAVAGSAGRSAIQDLDLHPLSLGQIWRDYDMIYGRSSRLHPTIPVERERFLIHKLQEFGITAQRAADENFREKYFLPAFHRAVARGRFFPGSNVSHPFVPPANFLSP